MGGHSNEAIAGRDRGVVVETRSYRDGALEAVVIEHPDGCRSLAFALTVAGVRTSSWHESTLGRVDRVLAEDRGHWYLFAAADLVSSLPPACGAHGSESWRRQHEGYAVASPAVLSIA